MAQHHLTLPSSEEKPKKKVSALEVALEVAKRIKELQDEGKDAMEICRILNKEGML